MAAITAAVTGVAALGSSVYQGNKARGAASDAARKQAEGVQAGIDATRQATQQAIPFVQQGFSDARSTLSPLAELSSLYTGERDSLLGLRGDEKYQSALNRVADPLQAEQERAIMRNSAALGGVGGNTLSALADQTRQRTEANIANRIGMLGNASAPGISALQQIAQLYSGEGGNIANTYLGQGSELSQLNQNMGTANAGGSAFAAQQPSPLAQGLQAGAGMYQAMGGSFSNPFSSSQPANTVMPTWVNQGNSAGTINLGMPPPGIGNI